MSDYILDSLIDLDDIEPMNFFCKKCDHSVDDHDNNKGRCEHGLMRKCDCRHFELDFDEVEEAKQELMKIEDKLFEDYKDAKRIHEI